MWTTTMEPLFPGLDPLWSFAINFPQYTRTMRDGGCGNKRILIEGGRTDTEKLLLWVMKAAIAALR